MKANKKYLIYILPVAGVLLLSLSTFIPFFLLIALAPLFSLFDLHGERITNRLWLFLSLIFVFVLSFTAWQVNAAIGSFTGAILYGVCIAFAFIIFRFTNQYSKNRLGYFTIAIYWLALEYFIVSIRPGFSRFALGGIFDVSPSIVQWSGLTGILGVSFWILLSNILWYHVFFRDHAIFNGKIRWLSLVYSLLIIALPYILTYFFTTDLSPATQADLIQFYNEHNKGTELSGYMSRGEWVGRSAAWVAVLIIIYSFVKRKTR